MNAVVQRQKEVARQLEVRGMLGQQLPNTVQEEQENRSLREAEEGAGRTDRLQLEMTQSNHGDAELEEAGTLASSLSLSRWWFVRLWKR